jgi:hypothetical protein
MPYFKNFYLGTRFLHQNNKLDEKLVRNLPPLVVPLQYIEVKLDMCKIKTWILREEHKLQTFENRSLRTYLDL